MTTTTSSLGAPTASRPFTRPSAWLRAAWRSMPPLAAWLHLLRWGWRGEVRVSGVAAEHNLARALAGLDARTLRDLGLECHADQRRRDRDALPAEYYRGLM